MTEPHDWLTRCAHPEWTNRPRISSTWLSNDMAKALAATAPALICTDVIRAADQLTRNTRLSRVTNDLLQCGADQLQADRVIEALLALRDIA